MLITTYGYRRVDTMKPSHLQAPRQLRDCYFATGYRCAEPRNDPAALGHKLVQWACLIGLVALVAMGAAGWLPGSRG